MLTLTPRPPRKSNAKIFVKSGGRRCGRGMLGTAGAAALAFTGGAVGAVVGTGASMAIGVAGLVGGGILGAKLAADYCAKHNVISAPGLFLVLGGVVGGAALGGTVGFYGGGALGAMAGARVGS